MKFKIIDKIIDEAPWYLKAYRLRWSETSQNKRLVLIIVFFAGLICLGLSMYGMYSITGYFGFLVFPIFVAWAIRFQKSKIAGFDRKFNPPASNYLAEKTPKRGLFSRLFLKAND